MKSLPHPGPPCTIEMLSAVNWSFAEWSGGHWGIVNWNREHCDALSHTSTVCVVPTSARPNSVTPYFWVPNTNSFGTMADGLQVPGTEPSEQCCGSEAHIPLPMPLLSFFMRCILKSDDVGHVTVYVSS